MPIPLRARIVAAGLLAASALASQAKSQDPGLGGFGGGSSSMGGGGMGANGSLVIPYAGMYRGFMASRMGGGDPVRLSSRSVSTPDLPRRPLGLAGASMGMGSNSLAGSGMGMKSDRILVPTSFGPRIGPSPSPMRAGGASMGVMPPNLGSPFRPPTILSAPTTGPGMAM